MNNKDNSNEDYDEEKLDKMFKVAKVFSEQDRKSREEVVRILEERKKQGISDWENPPKGKGSKTEYIVIVAIIVFIIFVIWRKFFVE